MLCDVFDRVPHAGYLFGVFVGYLDVELFLQPDYQLGGIQRVGSKVIDETRVGGDFSFVHAQLIDYYLFHPLFNRTFHFVAPPNGIRTQLDDSPKAASSDDHSSRYAAAASSDCASSTFDS